MSVDDQDDLTLDERINNGDIVAIYDALSEAVLYLTSIMDRVGDIVGGDAESLRRLGELREIKRTSACKATICSDRWGQDAAGKEVCGKERQRSRVTRSVRASHG